jgi:hypothetical protein
MLTQVSRYGANAGLVAIAFTSINQDTELPNIISHLNLAFMALNSTTHLIQYLRQLLA